MSLPEGLEIDISVECENWRDALPDYRDIVVTAVDVISKNVPEAASFSKFMQLELGVVLCDDAYIRELNNNFRGKDEATNVLSFEGMDENERHRYLTGGTNIPDHPFSLGEVYIAYETMDRERTTASITLKNHFFHLTIHGILHLLGYDHIEDHDAEVMESLETQLLANLGIDDPYAP